jgi:hypothetical protein
LRLRRRRDVLRRDPSESRPFVGEAASGGRRRSSLEAAFFERVSARQTSVSSVEPEPRPSKWVCLTSKPQIQVNHFLDRRTPRMLP